MPNIKRKDANAHQKINKIGLQVISYMVLLCLVSFCIKKKGKFKLCLKEVLQKKFF